MRGPSSFALKKQKRHGVNDMDPFGGEPRTQWDSITSCCTMLIGLETSKIVAVTPEFQFWSRTLLKTLVIMCRLHSGKRSCNCSSGRSVLCKDSSATLSFVKQSLSDRYDGTMKEMIQRQKNIVHSWWVLGNLVRNDFVGTIALEYDD